MSFRTTFLTFVLALLWATTATAQNGSWKILPATFPGLQVIWQLHAVDDSTLILSGETGNLQPLLFRSTNYGGSWTNITANITPNFGGVMHTIAGEGDTLYSLVSGFAYRSTNRGLHWEQVCFNQAQSGTDFLSPVTPDGRGYLVGTNSSYTYTDDRWQSFQYLSTGISGQDLKVIELVGTRGDTVLMGGEQVNTPVQVQICYTHDGGQSWFLPTGLPIGGVFDIKCVDQTCYCVGQNTTTVARIYKSTDAGVSWVDLHNNLPDFALLRKLSKIDCFDENNCIAVGGKIAFGARDVIYRTQDGGSVWTLDSLGYPNIAGVANLIYRSPTLGYGVIDGPLIIKYELNPSGVEEMETVNVTVSPNPSSADFSVNLSVAQNATLLLLNNLGQVVSSQSLSGTSTLVPRTDLANGTYHWLVIGANNNLLGHGQLVLF